MKRLPTKRLVLLTGLSGSGKSTALHALEDAGYFAIDNLPAELFPHLLEGISRRSPLGRIESLAVAMDARDEEFVHHVSRYLSLLRKTPVRLRVLFLEAQDDVLIRRFSETRRRHPLAAQGNLRTAIRRERNLLQPLRAVATDLIDTSRLNVHQLKGQVTALLRTSRVPSVTVQLLSFGYRFGIPLESDLILDVRFLPNPHFIKTLRAHSGLTVPVRRYVLRQRECRQFLQRVRPLLRFLLPRYQTEGKASITLAIGCTGGRHRSAVIAQKIGSDLKRWGYAVTLTHRDLGKKDSSP